MRVAIAAASVLAALLIFIFLAPCPPSDPGERMCRDTACAQAARSSGGWSLGNRFSLLNLPRLAFPFPRDAADCGCWS
ncbi:hypothetical protein [Achromobacter sp. UMC71]|uniref:hypothetical protein n=1 Tax=Achromobacter sp. UMC71 TaxID=1862320 RepID=UPI0016020ADD|nr:hypothetical protein [Achromobacter sp. UMC71]MBB1625874.1 hypothetical protein [Achromobacter sp. UMC71]